MINGIFLIGNSNDIFIKDPYGYSHLYFVLNLTELFALLKVLYWLQAISINNIIVGSDCL